MYEGNGLWASGAACCDVGNILHVAISVESKKLFVCYRAQNLPHGCLCVTLERSCAYAGFSSLDSKVV